MFGNYWHALTSHAPQQLCLNTENYEQFFGQARHSATLTSNRTSENIIFNILLRLQAKQSTGNLPNLIKNSDSQVRRAASNLERFSGTVKLFISTRNHSWQAHLELVFSWYMGKECGDLRQHITITFLMVLLIL